MRQPPAHVSRGRLVGVCATALWAVATVTLASPALAHDVLVGTDPADGAVLDAAPPAVVLTFAAEQAGVGAEVVVTGPDGASWSAGAAVVDGTTVTQPLAAGMPDGAYAVAWRSVAQDGHPVTGAFGFTLDVPDAEATGEPADTPTATDEPEAEEPATDEPTLEPATDPTPAAPVAAADDGDGGWTSWHTAAAALVAVLAAVLAVVVRRSRRG